MVQLPAWMAAKTSSKIKERQTQSLQWDQPLLHKQPSGHKEELRSVWQGGGGECWRARDVGGDETSRSLVYCG